MMNIFQIKIDIERNAGGQNKHISEWNGDGCRFVVLPDLVTLTPPEYRKQ